MNNGNDCSDSQCTSTIRSFSFPEPKVPLVCASIDTSGLVLVLRDCDLFGQHRKSRNLVDLLPPQIAQIVIFSQSVLSDLTMSS